eukprot:Protomagalhaensia_wolfi_Nauph_80__2169@NODE_239_length_3073_cov_20_308833_g179_i0_p2_GENE_NODE_239_length_3073_cov_20_308833_g179_i0NODE_239_length_3073_cov_20_308833_g179_i0_p2_ORF_typecomplete_len464_score74_07_NODE_239_length_3073_cov_20_308833_g179_i0311392
MKPLAIFHAVEVAGVTPKAALYFVLVSDFPKSHTPPGEQVSPSAADLPPPFKLGPYQFGKNRVSVLSFGRVEIRIARFQNAADYARNGSGAQVAKAGTRKSSRFRLTSAKSYSYSARHPHSTETPPRLQPSLSARTTIGSPEVVKDPPRSSWCFEISNRRDSVTIDAANPFVLFSVLDNTFEELSHLKKNRLRQVARLAIVAGDCLLKINPSLDWISDRETRAHIMYSLSTSCILTLPETLAFLNPLRPAFSRMLSHDPEARSESGFFNSASERIQINFAVLAKCALCLAQRSDNVSLLQRTTCDQPVPVLYHRDNSEYKSPETFRRIHYQMSVDMVIRSKDWDSGDEEDDVEVVSIEDPTPQVKPTHPTLENCSPSTEDPDSDSLEEFDLSSTSWGKLSSPSASPTPVPVDFARKISMFSPQSGREQCFASDSVMQRQQQELQTATGVGTVS